MCAASSTHYMQPALLQPGVYDHACISLDGTTTLAAAAWRRRQQLAHRERLGTSTLGPTSEGWRNSVSWDLLSNAYLSVVPICSAMERIDSSSCSTPPPRCDMMVCEENVENEWGLY